MSKYSGKCDLFDHMMMEKTYQKDGYLVSDELECFEIFKKKTGGVLHQHYKVKVNFNNQEFVKIHCPEFDFIERTKEVADKRQKSGVRVDTYYTYTYYGKLYSLAELNKKGVWITVDIHFDTLLDLIPYYPYIISSVVCDGDKETIYISKRSFVDEEFEEHLQFGWISEVNYKKELQEHYLEVCRDYFLKDINKRTKIISIKNLVYAPYMNDTESTEKHYILNTTTEIDYMHEVEFVWADGKIHEHWTSPKIVGNNAIELSPIDVESFLKDDIANKTVKIKYVEKMDFERKLQ